MVSIKWVAICTTRQPAPNRHLAKNIFKGVRQRAQPCVRLCTYCGNASARDSHGMALPMKMWLWGGMFSGSSRLQVVTSVSSGEASSVKLICVPQVEQNVRVA